MWKTSSKWEDFFSIILLWFSWNERTSNIFNGRRCSITELLEAELRLQRKEEVEATNKTIVDKMLMQMKKSDPDPL